MTHSACDHCGHITVLSATRLILSAGHGAEDCDLDGWWCKLDNTLIIYIGGDNGNSAEGSLIGTPNQVASLQGIDVPVEDQLKYFYGVWGSDQTYPHMAVAWTWAFDTPFSWTKQIASHFGGTRQGMAI
jgi:arylsulfatase A-like enzyme